MSGAGNAWNNQRFLCWIHWVSDVAAWAKWLHILVYKASINKYFFSILIGGWDIGLAKNIINLIYLDIGVAKNMQGVLCKWMPQDKYFKYQNFPTYFLSSLFLECFGEIWQKLFKFLYPKNLPKEVLFLLKSNGRF